MIGEEGQLPTPGKPVVLQPKEATSILYPIIQTTGQDMF